MDRDDLQITVAMLRAICDAIEEADIGEEVDIHNLSSYGALSLPQLNKLLLEAAGPNSLDHEEISGSPLNLQVLEVLLDNGAEIECHDEEGNSPLYRAVLHDQIHEMEFLLEKGAAVDGIYRVANDLEGESCLSTAVQLGNCDMVKVLLKYGADRRTPSGMLFFAAADSDVEMVQLLVDGEDDLKLIDPLTELSLCDTAFAIAVTTERELIAYRSGQFELAPHSLSSELLHLTKERLLRQHRKKMEVIRYLLQKGCQAPASRQVRHAVELESFLTLTETYRMCLQCRCVMEWADFYHPPLNWSSSVGVDVLADFVRRTRTTQHRRDEGVLLRHLDGILQVEKGDYWVPRLAHLALAVIRQCLSGRVPGVTAGLKTELLAGLPLPSTVKNLIALTDLDDRFEQAKDRFREEVLCRKI